MPLNLTNELQGLNLKLFSIGGTGEFTYDNGRLVSATNQVSDGGFNARFNPNGRATPQPKLFQVQKQTPGMPNYFGGRRASGPVTIAAKIPHLACRIPITAGDPLFALLEEDTSVPEPMNAPPQSAGGMHWGGPPQSSALRFLPLDFRAGDTDRKLTFVVQKPRTAEFIVRVARNTRSTAQESE